MLAIPLLLALAASPPAPAAPKVEPITVHVEGHGPPVLLIPGLACGGEVWGDTVAHLRAHYTVHVLSLAGFAGKPAIGAPFLPRVEQALAAYLRAQHLRKAAVVGHSLGGTLALELAAREPALVGKVVAVDGVPFLPALNDPSATPASVEPQVRQMRDALGRLSPAQYAPMARASLASMITDPAKLDREAAVSGTSDPAAVGEAVYELATTDLRPEMGRIRAPVLLLAAEGLIPPANRAAMTRAYEAQVAAVPTHTVVADERARHFIMLDDPSFFFAQLDRFLAGGAR